MGHPTRRSNPANAPEGRYANYFEVMHSACEFIVDFGQYHPEQTAAQMHIRVVTGPVYAKLLARMLSGAVDRHEREYGEIQIDAVAPATASGGNGDCDHCALMGGGKPRD